MKGIYFLLIATAVVLSGCEPSAPKPKPVESNPAEVTPTVTPAAETPKAPVASPSPAILPTPTPEPTLPTEVTPKQPVAQVAQPPAPVVQPSTRQSRDDDQWATDADLGGTRQTAEPGMGKKGRGYGGDTVTYPIAAYFKVRERIALDHMKKAMQLYQALNGHYPRTQDEFRKQIIKANRITLAVLPDGHKYYYDPDKHELMVIKTP